LDVEIVLNAVRDGLIKHSEIDPMMQEMMKPERSDQFQKFITNNMLSSNMQFVARKR